MKTKWNLTKSEQRIHSLNAERLKLAGLATGVEIEGSYEAPLLLLEQTGESIFYAGTRKGMALAIGACVTVLKSGVDIRDCEITIPGCSANISLVEPQEGSPIYRVFNWLDFPKDVVLNHQILCGGPLPVHRILDGFLIAWSFDTLPSHFQSRIKAQICFEYQSGKFFTSEVQLMVERRELKVRPKECRLPAGTSCRHPVPAQDKNPGSRDPKPVLRMHQQKEIKWATKQEVGRDICDR